ncbi:vacuolar protein [Penicillium digitatum]|uniref:Vacuolar protein n=1 Tax=Penicillium digitatum TaxID=36651 RepID=A0A7T7BJS0_PENDI|nr:vacuolar protein [Penicillium digitatum]
MSLDRIIQDSDEDEPFEGDNLPTSANPLHPSEPALPQEYQYAPAKQMTHNAVYEYDHAPDESMFPQLNVNFDDFLQSQDKSHSMLSSSQQRREDRWIPSTSEGGSGSVGAMMTEIGLAQRRLLDEDPSSASLPPPSTTALFPTESFQSAPFPTLPSHYSYQMAQPESSSFTRNPAPISVYAGTNQSLLPTRQGIYDLNPPDTTHSMAYAPKIVPHQATEPSMEQENLHPNPQSNKPQEASQPKCQQTGSYSPHDTEPLSSIASMRFSEAKITTAGTSLISPHQSQSSTHDELALPAILPTMPDFKTPDANKKRRRPKKQHMLENDEDDELANSRDHEFKQTGANEAAPKLAKPGPKEPRKKKVKTSKTTPAPEPDDDDVIWIDTKPLSVDPSTGNATPQTEATEAPRRDLESNDLASNLPVDPQSATPAVEEKTQNAQKAEKPAPKKRGRKRKQITELAETSSECADTPEPNKSPSGAQTPASKLAVVVDNSPKSMVEANTGNNDASATKSKDQNTPPLPGPESLFEAAIDTSHPQTPSKPDAASVNTPQNAGKGPDKHSPISARSGVPYRVGLSKRARIAPLLKMVRK